MINDCTTALTAPIRRTDQCGPPYRGSQHVTVRFLYPRWEGRSSMRLIRKKAGLKWAERVLRDGKITRRPPSLRTLANWTSRPLSSPNSTTGQLRERPAQTDRPGDRRSDRRIPLLAGPRRPGWVAPPGDRAHQRGRRRQSILGWNGLNWVGTRAGYSVAQPTAEGESSKLYARAKWMVFFVPTVRGPDLQEHPTAR